MNSEFLLELIKRSKLDGFKLICVTKNRSCEEVNEALSLGVTDIGENRVKEAEAKFRELKYPCRKHLIGHLQTNKSRLAVDLFDSIHSIDSLKIAEKVNESAKSINKVIDVFFQLNISGEESKYGFSEDEFSEVYRHLCSLEFLNPIGLMTMAPYSIEEKEISKIFKRLKVLSAKYSLPYTSMGMSGDYELALEERSTHVRIGSKIFS